MATDQARAVEVDPARFVRWVDKFASTRSGLVLTAEDAELHGSTEDGSWFRAALPWPGPGPVPPDPHLWAAAAEPPEQWGVLLVRKGGFAVARMHATTMVEHKVGQRHVQGRTKAGGQSQQRFARRRDNQARQAYEAAAGHAARILAPLPDGAVLVTAGDATALSETIAVARLGRLGERHLVGSIADPRRSVLDEAVRRAQCLTVTVHNS